QRLHQHRAWINQNLLASAAALSDEQLRRSFAIGQGSVWKSLLHMYGAESAWLEALLGREQFLVPGDLPGKLPGNQLGQGAIASFDELREKWSQLEGRWSKYLAELSPDSFEDVVYRVRSDGERFSSRRADILLHVCTHAHYTSAQVVNMLRQLGVE